MPSASILDYSSLVGIAVPSTPVGVRSYNIPLDFYLELYAIDISIKSELAFYSVRTNRLNLFQQSHLTELPRRSLSLTPAASWDDFCPTSSPINMGLTTCYFPVSSFPLRWHLLCSASQTSPQWLRSAFCTDFGLAPVRRRVIPCTPSLNKYLDVSLIPSLLAQLSSHAGEHGWAKLCVLLPMLISFV